ncbi:uracil-DNA glycosylase [Halomarina litorea]|uniref:uracil-DNA glycosylase n=1 Tax=Halomarina litorea TaxID=2961595 RepID=UPI0020C21157|nr:uracil-DNA glycosylase [Halomarina sp. BCD28]
MENVTDRTSNPFGMRPSCEAFVPGYGDANAEFHVVGDHPGVHGGAATGTSPDGGSATVATARSDDDSAPESALRVPFTNEAGLRLQRALVEGGLLASAGPRPEVNRTFLSYLHMCVPDDGETPEERDYVEMERFFDAELRAIAAHVLLPVGERATRHVLANYTADDATGPLDMTALHGTEILGSGFLVYPIRDPGEWEEGDHDRLVGALHDLQSTDFHREVDLGRFLPGDDDWRVR